MTFVKKQRKENRRRQDTKRNTELLSRSQQEQCLSTLLLLQNTSVTFTKQLCYCYQVSLLLLPCSSVTLPSNSVTFYQATQLLLSDNSCYVTKQLCYFYQTTLSRLPNNSVTFDHDHDAWSWSLIWASSSGIFAMGKKKWYLCVRACVCRLPPVLSRRSSAPLHDVFIRSLCAAMRD